MLARLPYAFRHKLYLCLSPADVLHYRLKSNVFDDIKDDDCRHQLDEANEALLDVLFGKTSNPIDFLHTRDLLTLMTCKKPRPHIVYINKCYSSLQFLLANYNGASLSGLLPKRSLRYLNLQRVYDEPHFSHSSLGQLLEYCNAPTSPREIELDLNFLDGLLWLEFDNVFKNHTRKIFDLDDTDLKMNPALPFMQEYFSTVEIVRLGSFRRAFYTVFQMVTYVVLYNIVTCQQPRLKHIEVYGYPDVVVGILTNVVKLCSDCDQSPVCFSLPKPMIKLMLASPPAPYLLKGLSISPESSSLLHANRISGLTRNLVTFQLHNLERVIIDKLGLCVYGSVKRCSKEYCDLLSVLTELLRQPQLQFMSVSVSPLPEVYSLIEAFLCTETTHHQTLRVVGNRVEFNDNDGSGPICKKMKMDSTQVTQPLPASNGTFKTLDIGSSSHRLHAWLFSIPNLQLKELRTSKISLVPDNVGFPVTESMR